MSWSVARLDEVVDAHRVLLAEAVQPADALLDFHRVPRQVEIGQAMRELQIAPFSAVGEHSARALEFLGDRLAFGRESAPLMTR